MGLGEKTPLLLAGPLRPAPIAAAGSTTVSHSATVGFAAAPTDAVRNRSPSTQLAARVQAARQAASRVRWAWSALPWLPPTIIPREQFPVSHYRHRLYIAFSQPRSSKIGVIVFLTSLSSILSFAVAFTVASLPEYRLREVHREYGDPEVAFDVVDAIISAVYTVTYVVRLCCVTAVPDADERRLLLRAQGRDDGKSTADPPAPDGAFDDDANDGVDGLEEDDLFDAKASDSSPAKAGSEVTTSSTLPPYWTQPACSRCRRIHRTSVSSSGGGGQLQHSIQPLLSRNLPRLLSWITNFYNLIDLLTVLPYFVDILTEDIDNDSHAAPLRVLRFLCLLRLLRLMSDTITLRLLRRAVQQGMSSLYGALFLIVIALFFFSAGIFIVERGDWDDTSQDWMRPNVRGDGTEPSPFRSVLHALYWTATTMTTLGYGDLVPTTPAGKLIAGLTVGAGLLVLAMPATLIGFNFTAAYERYKVKVAETQAKKQLLQQQAAARANQNSNAFAHGRGAAYSPPTAAYASRTRSPEQLLRRPATVSSLGRAALQQPHASLDVDANDNEPQPALGASSLEFGVGRTGSASGASGSSSDLLSSADRQYLSSLIAQEVARSTESLVGEVRALKELLVLQRELVMKSGHEAGNADHQNVSRRAESSNDAIR